MTAVNRNRMYTLIINRWRGFNLVLILVWLVSCRADYSVQNHGSPTPTSPPPVTSELTLPPTETTIPSPTPGEAPEASGLEVSIQPAGGQTTKLSHFPVDGAWINLPVPVGVEGAPNVVVDLAGRVWVGNDEGVSLFTPGEEDTLPTWVTYTVSDGLPSNQVNALAVDSKNQIWAATPKGVAVFDGTSWINHHKPGGLISNYVSSIAVGSDGVVWANTGGKLHRFDGQSWIPLEGPILASSPIVIDRREHIWVISSMESVSRFDGATWTIYDQILEELNSVRTNTFGLWPVATLTIDRNGQIWVGAGQCSSCMALSPDDCAQRGVFGRPFSRFDGRTWQVLVLETGESNIPGCSGDYDPLNFDQAGNPWVGTRKFEGTTEQSEVPEGIAGDVLTIAVGPRGRNWFGTTQGLSIRSMEMFEPPSENIRVVYHDVSTYDLAGVPIYQSGVLPWIDLLVKHDGQWYGPERMRDEIQARPLESVGLKWEATGGFSTLPNGEAWWNETDRQGMATLYGPDETAIYTVTLKIEVEGEDIRD